MNRNERNQWIARNEHNEITLKKANTVGGFTSLIKLITDLLTIWIK